MNVQEELRLTSQVVIAADEADIPSDVPWDRRGHLQRLVRAEEPGQERQRGRAVLDRELGLAADRPPQPEAAG
jgi:hypothetical protein